MAVLTCTFFSNILQKSVQFNAIVPRDKERDARVLYLLHGLSDDYTAWSRFSSIERYANDAGLVIVMPDGGKSFYTDMMYGDRYYSFFVNEFFDYASSLLGFSQNREDTFIGGLSMGGYGALKIALRNPNRFSAVASLSGAVDICNRLKRDPRWSDIQKNVFGEKNDPTGTKDDLFFLIKNHVNQKPLRIYLSCGREDFLYQDNVAFADAVSNAKFRYKFECPHGIHDWNFWDLNIKKAIDYLLK